jgi:hypothetical protein
MASEIPHDAGEAFGAKTKEGFDRQLIKEYVANFKRSRRGPDGNPIPVHQIWIDLADKLRLSYDAKRRYVKGLDKHGNRPVSLLDGQTERYEPGFEEIFRYIAALDLIVDFFPRGRVITNQAVARALTGIRKHTQAYHGSPISAVEVERLRFLRLWKYNHKSGRTFPPTVITDMYNSLVRDLMEPIEKTDRFLEGLNRLFADWDFAMTELLGIVSYDWLRCE